MKVSELLVRSLESYGVERAYGLVGTSILELMDALKDSKIRYVSTRHEQVAVSMADADGRMTGLPGVAFVHGGGGFLNSLVSVCNAWKDGSPLLLVAGAVKKRMVGMDSWLEIPQSQMISSLVKKTWRVERGADAGRIFAEAFSMAVSPPKGPVFVEVPEDVWPLEGGSQIVRLALTFPQEPREQEVSAVAKKIADSKRPLIVAGGGINSDEGSRALSSLLARVEIPVVTTGNGRGAIPEDHHLALGRIGFGGGSAVADAALAEADLVLCLGGGLSDVSTYGFNLTPKGETIAVNLDTLWDRKPVHYESHFESDAVTFTQRLAAICDRENIQTEWMNFIDRQQASWRALLKESASHSKLGFVNPARFLLKLDEHLPDDTVITAGQGVHLLYAYSFLKVRSSRGFLAATNMGSMGFVFPAALGAKMAFPRREVVGVMGDGEFLMTIQDLETAVREKISPKIVVVNDNSYRVLLMRQKIQKMGRVFGTTHANPDFVKLAESFGADAMVVDSDDKIDSGIRFITGKSEAPIIVELKIDPEDLPPLNMRGSLMF